MQVEMKSLNKNTKLNERFRSSETIEKASLDEVNYNYLYEDENNYFFMEPKSFEQIEIKKEIVEEIQHKKDKIGLNESSVLYDNKDRLIEELKGNLKKSKMV